MSCNPGRLALVTGGAGFIGGHIVERLLTEDWNVRVLDDFSTGSDENLADCREHVELFRGDVRDPEIVARAMRGVEVVFHQAAIASVPRSIAEPLYTNDVNVGGTLQVLETARNADVRRVVFAASSAAYGDGPELPKVESLPAEPLSPYAVQKYVSEIYCHQYTALYGLETVALRYFNIFGPRQDPNSDYAAVIPKFITAALTGQRPSIYGTGEQSRDFVFVGDAARANLLAADSERAPGSVVNVATEQQISLNQLWEEIRKIVGCEFDPIYEPARPGDVLMSVGDLCRSRELLGYEPSIGLAEGLRQTIENFSKTVGEKRSMS